MGQTLGPQHQCACCGSPEWGRPWVPNTSVPAVAPLNGADPGFPTPVCLPWLLWIPNTSVPAVAPLNGADPGFPTPVCLPWLPWMGQTLDPQHQCACRGSAGWGRPWVLSGGALGPQHQCACRGSPEWGRPWVPNTSVLPWLPWMGQTLGPQHQCAHAGGILAAAACFAFSTGLWTDSQWSFWYGTEDSLRGNGLQAFGLHTPELVLLCGAVPLDTGGCGGSTGKSELGTLYRVGTVRKI
ncbi:hypothetical protein LEMLEM_LOCUS12196 [Lemmus lemmus]